MSKIAIIGTGISGLSAAWLLNPHHEITVYEKEGRIGGHSRTVTVRHGDRIIPVDTGFIVFNERNYPNLAALFRRLGVAVKKSDMSFGLTADDGGFEWGARNINAVFGQRSNLFRPKFLKLFAEVMRFNAGALAAVEREPEITLGQLISRMKLGDWFQRYYLLPMGGAIWSCPPKQMLSFPASTFVRFFENHGLLSLGGQPQWFTVNGGSQVYVERLSESFSHRVRTNCAATEVRREGGSVRVKDVRGIWDRYDEVVFASHADETLTLLPDAETAEREALSAIKYQRNRVILHKDPRFMPKRKACWASWVYHAQGHSEAPAIAVTYWMNRLQSIDQNYPLFVTLNPQSDISSEHVFDEHLFDHPVFDTGAIAAQEKLRAMQGVRNTWFCGAHMRHGFHEDGLVSAMDVAARLGAPAPWLSPQPVWRPVREPAYARPRFADQPVVAD